MDLFPELVQFKIAEYLASEDRHVPHLVKLYTIPEYASTYESRMRPRDVYGDRRLLAPYGIVGKGGRRLDEYLWPERFGDIVFEYGRKDFTRRAIRVRNYPLIAWLVAEHNIRPFELVNWGVVGVDELDGLMGVPGIHRPPQQYAFAWAAHEANIDVMDWLRRQGLRPLGLCFDDYGGRARDFLKEHWGK